MNDRSNKIVWNQVGQLCIYDLKSDSIQVKPKNDSQARQRYTTVKFDKDNRIWGIEFLSGKLVIMNRDFIPMAEFESGEVNICTLALPRRRIQRYLADIQELVRVLHGRQHRVRLSDQDSKAAAHLRIASRRRRRNRQHHQGRLHYEEKCVLSVPMRRRLLCGSILVKNQEVDLLETQ